LPAASHDRSLVQLSGSGAFVIAVQAPVPVAQVWQLPQALALQHWPSTQKPLRHCVPAVQAWPGRLRQAPLASQLWFPAQLSGSSALITAAQVPPVPVHAWQVPQLAAPQQWASTQWAEEQSPATEHAWPDLFRQVPAASQVRVPLQVSASSALATVPQVPVELAHVWHEAPQAVLQQCRSAQRPVTQSVPTAQVWPCLVLQAPVESQVSVPMQLSGSSALVTATQVPPPPVQAWHFPQAETPQQWPSMQDPDMHAVPAEHAPPFVILVWQAPALVQYCGEGQGAVTGSQPLAHIVVLAHRLLLQAVLMPALHAPMWLQVGAGVAMPFAQLGLPHIVC
jgi:hypothetical protein